MTGLISLESKGLSRVFSSTNCSIVFQAEDETAEHQCSGDVMVEWHHRLSGHEFEQTLGDSQGQRSLACCNPWSCKE